MKKPLIILTGPTAVGKTDLSLRLARRIGGEIISADSMQVYRHMDIGSAKIMPQEMEGIPHHLIDVLEPSESFHVVRFQQMAKEAMNAIYANGHIPIVTGGTGFYIQALLYDIDFEDTCEDTSYREMLEKLAEEKGDEELHRMVADVDPASAEAIHCHNRKRLIRALEYYHLTGKRISEHNEQERQRSSPYDFSYFVLNRNRAVLYDRINRRVDQMMDAGLVEEVRRLKEMGYDRSYVSMQGIGYKELLAWLDGELSLEDTVELIKKDTRHFAKRQLTWFKRERDITWIDLDTLSEDEALERMVQAYQKEGCQQEQAAKCTGSSAERMSVSVMEQQRN